MNNNKHKRPVISVSIASGEVTCWPSLAFAAATVESSPANIRKAADRVKQVNGQVWCNPGDEQRAVALAKYLHRNDIAPSKRGRPKKTSGMVWLQLDSHTRILVKPEEATPEFAVNYLKRLNRPARQIDPVG